MFNILNRLLQKNRHFVLCITFLTILPGHGLASSEHSVLLVGDSVMVALSPRFTNAANSIIGGDGWNVMFQASVCRKATAPGCLHGTPQSALSVLKENHGLGIEAVVIMIGHNDNRGASFIDKVHQLLNEVSDVPHVFLITMREVSHSYREANRMIKEASAGHQNVHIIDWAELSRNQNSWVAKDGTHITATGAKNLASLIAQELRTWCVKDKAKEK